MGGRLEHGSVPQQHISPGQGEGPGTLTLCRAPSQVELWSTELAHTLTTEHYEKDSFAFFPHVLETRVGFCVSSSLRGSSWLPLVQPEGT